MVRFGVEITASLPRHPEKMKNDKLQKLRSGERGTGAWQTDARSDRRGVGGAASGHRARRPGNHLRHLHFTL